MGLRQRVRFDNVCSDRDCAIDGVSVMGFFEWSVLFLIANISAGISLLPADLTNEELWIEDLKVIFSFAVTNVTIIAWFVSGSMVLWNAALWVFGLFSG